MQWLLFSQGKLVFYSKTYVGPEGHWLGALADVLGPLPSKDAFTWRYTEGFMAGPAATGYRFYRNAMVWTERRVWNAGNLGQGAPSEEILRVTIIENTWLAGLLAENARSARELLNWAHDSALKLEIGTVPSDLPAVAGMKITSVPSLYKASGDRWGMGAETIVDKYERNPEGMRRSTTIYSMPIEFVAEIINNRSNQSIYRIPAGVQKELLSEPKPGFLSIVMSPTLVVRQKGGVSILLLHNVQRRALHSGAPVFSNLDSGPPKNDPAVMVPPLVVFQLHTRLATEVFPPDAETEKAANDTIFARPRYWQFGDKWTIGVAYGSTVLINAVPRTPKL